MTQFYFDIIHFLFILYITCIGSHETQQSHYDMVFYEVVMVHYCDYVDATRRGTQQNKTMAPRCPV